MGHTNDNKENESEIEIAFREQTVRIKTVLQDADKALKVLDQLIKAEENTNPKNTALLNDLNQSRNQLDARVTDLQTGFHKLEEALKFAKGQQVIRAEIKEKLPSGRIVGSFFKNPAKVVDAVSTHVKAYSETKTEFNNQLRISKLLCENLSKEINQQTSAIGSYYKMLNPQKIK